MNATQAKGFWAIQPTHISEIRPGDTVEIDGYLKTVCHGDIRKGFMGRTLWGDSYHLGAKPVARAIFTQPTKEQQ